MKQTDVEISYHQGTRGAQAAREWADRLAAIPSDALKGPRTLKQRRADTARRQEAARVREANR